MENGGVVFEKSGMQGKNMWILMILGAKMRQNEEIVKFVGEIIVKF